MPRKPVGNQFLSRAAEVGPSVFSAGAVGVLNKAPPTRAEVCAFYTHPSGTLYLGDAIAWLASLPSGSVDLVFADPPYNLGKAGWDNFESHDHYVEWSVTWITEAARVLKPTGSLYVCGFSEILADLRRPCAPIFGSCRWLVWHYKNKANLSSDWGRSHESIIHFRREKFGGINVDDVRVPYGNHTLKYPEHPQAESSQYGKGRPRAETWKPNPNGAKPRDVIELPVTSNGMGEKTPHPTQKPEELLRRLILASSNAGDLVIDPFSGSGTTLVCAEQLGRRWAGADLSAEYSQWAAMRLEKVERRSVSEWITLDRATTSRREGIR